MREIFGRPFDLLLGRRTYDIFAAHWSYISDPHDTFAAMFDGITKYVAPRSSPVKPRSFRTGVIVTRYTPDGAVRTGDFSQTASRAPPSSSGGASSRDPRRERAIPVRAPVKD